MSTHYDVGDIELELIEEAARNGGLLPKGHGPDYTLAMGLLLMLGLFAPDHSVRAYRLTVDGVVFASERGWAVAP